MSKEKQLKKKKKERERKNKQEVLRRREVIRKDQKEVNDKRKKQRETKKLLKEKEKLEVMNEQAMQNMPPDIRKKIEHNIKILRALEEEHAKEMKAKETINKGLEEKGYFTLEQKLSALNEMQKLSVEDEIQEGGQVGGSADCSMTVNEQETEEE